MPTAEQYSMTFDRVRVNRIFELRPLDFDAPCCIFEGYGCSIPQNLSIKHQIRRVEPGIDFKYAVSRDAVKPDDSQQILGLGLDGMEISASSVAEAKSALSRVRNLQKQLRQIKRNVNLDMKTIRAEYQQKMSTAASTSSGILTLFGQRKMAGTIRADQKRRLGQERDRALQPYQSINLQIDHLLVQLDSVKLQIDEFIEAKKAAEQ